MICRDPLGPMEIGSQCKTCGHPAPAHSYDGPCAICVVEEHRRQIQNLAQRIEDAFNAEG